MRAKEEPEEIRACSIRATRGHSATRRASVARRTAGIAAAQEQAFAQQSSGDRRRA